MKKSIGAKISALLIAVIAAVIVLGILCNSFLLEPFYLRKNQTAMENTARTAEEILWNDPSGLLFLARTENVMIYLLDKQYDVIVSTANQTSKEEAGKLPREIEEQLQNHEFPFYNVTQKGNETSPNIVFAKETSYGEIIVVTKSLKGIRESVSIANQFYLYVGAVILLLGLLASLWLARTVTRPIVRMKNVTAALAQLDFEQKVCVLGQDELAQLGNSINHMSDQLSLAVSRLTTDVARRKQLIRDLSHELKTPIALIKGYAEGLSHHLATTSEKREAYLQTIVQECDRVDQLVKSMLHLSKLESGVLVPRNDEICVRPFLLSIADRFSTEALKKHTQIEIQCTEEQTVRGDKEQLSIAVSNYLLNALQHVNNGGSIKIAAEKEDDVLKISVANSGSHLDPENAEKLWEPFFRLSASRERENQNHGLGLAIAKSIAELHGGHVAAENFAQGVRFSISIPLAFHPDFTKPS